MVGSFVIYENVGCIINDNRTDDVSILKGSASRPLHYRPFENLKLNKEPKNEITIPPPHNSPGKLLDSNRSTES